MDAPEDFHDPLQCGKQRRQFLSADKLSVGFFLGAGCPTAVRITQDGKAGDEPLIPDIKGLTKTVREETSASQLCGKAFAQLLTVLKEDGEDTPTVEVMLNRIRALRDVAGRANVRGLTFRDRSEEHTSELQSRIRLSYAGIC